MTGVRKIISGGQIGADIAGLRAAKYLGLQTGGWLPHGWKTAHGARPEYAKEYGCIEHASESYAARTFTNVREADATIRLAFNFNSPGEKCTLRAIREYGKPYFDVQFEVHAGLPSQIITYSSHGEVAQWLLENEIKILNVAGNAKVELEPIVEKFLIRVLTGRAS